MSEPRAMRASKSRTDGPAASTVRDGVLRAQRRRRRPARGGALVG